jgi:hypothetical protein
VAEQIIIEFIADSSQLTPTIDALQKLGTIDAKTADAFKKTNTELSKRAQALEKVESEERKQIKTLGDLERAVESAATSFVKGFQEGVAGALADAGVSLMDIRKKLGLVSQDSPFMKLQKQIDEVNKRMLDTATRLQQLKRNGGVDTEGFKKLEKQLEADKVAASKLAVAMGEINNSVNFQEAEGKTQSFRSRLRELREELNRLEDAGQEGTSYFQSLAIEAAQLEDQIGDTSARIRAMASDTANIDAVVQGVGLFSSALQLGTGAQAFFGDESENLQKVLVKLGAVMSITNGIQEIQNVLQRQNILVIKAQAAGQAILAASTRATSAAFAGLGLSVQESSLAFKAFRAAVITTGVGALIVGLGFLIQKLNVFSDASDEAAKSTAALTAELDIQGRLLERDEKAIDSRTQMLIANAKRRGATDAEINAITITGYARMAVEKENSVQRILKADKAYYDATGTRLDLVIRNSEDARKALDGLDKAIAGVSTMPMGLTKDDLENSKKVVQEVFSLLKDAEDYRRKVTLANAQFGAEQAEKQRDEAKKQAEKDKEAAKLATENALKSARARADALVLEAKQGSQKELQARIAAFMAAQREELNNVNLTQGERLRIIANTNRQIQDLRFEYEKAQLVDAKRAVDAQVLLAKEGSRDELTYKLVQLTAARDVELKDQQLTANKRKEIEARYQKDRFELIRAYNRQVAEDTLNASLSSTNTQLQAMQIAGVSQTNQAVLELKKQAIDQQADLDILSAQNQIKNEQLLQARLLEIRTKAAADKVALERQAQGELIELGRQYADTFIDNEIKRQQLVIAGAGLDFNARRAAMEKIKNLEAARLDGEERSLKEQLDKKLITQEQYNQKMLELEGKRIDKELQMAQEKEQRKREIMDAGLQVLTELSAAYFESEAQDRQRALDAALASLNVAKQRELDNKNLTEQQKRDIEARYKVKEAAIKRQAWIKERDAKATEALIQGALNILKVFPNPILMALAAVTTGISYSKIKGQKVPEFAKGTRNAPKGMAWVGEEGPELVELRGGEKIYTYAESKRLAASWDKNRLRAIDAEISANIPRSVDPEIISNTVINSTSQLQIDYDALGRSVAKYLPEPVQVNNTLDENGFSSYLLEKGNKTEIRNKRYTL